MTEQDKLALFSELPKMGKAIAVKGYQEGWKETHPDESLTWEEAYQACMDTNDDVYYYKNGVEAGAV